MGLRHAKWLLMSGESIDAEDGPGHRPGQPRGAGRRRCWPKRMSMAERLASKSAATSAAIKEALHRGLDRPLDDALAAERELAVRHQGSDDAAIGFAAFRDRRTPEFPNRK